MWPLQDKTSTPQKFKLMLNAGAVGTCFSHHLGPLPEEPQLAHARVQLPQDGGRLRTVRHHKAGLCIQGRRGVQSRDHLFGMHPRQAARSLLSIHAVDIGCETSLEADSNCFAPTSDFIFGKYMKQCQAGNAGVEGQSLEPETGAPQQHRALLLPCAVLRRCMFPSLLPRSAIRLCPCTWKSVPARNTAAPACMPCEDLA